MSANYFKQAILETSFKYTFTNSTLIKAGIFNFIVFWRGYSAFDLPHGGINKCALMWSAQIGSSLMRSAQVGINRSIHILAETLKNVVCIERSLIFASFFFPYFLKCFSIIFIIENRIAFNAISLANFSQNSEFFFEVLCDKKRLQSWIFLINFQRKW